MKFYGIDISVLVIALITAYIGYQFNFRARKKEAFLKELLISYNETYFPMKELLQEIVEHEERDTKLRLIESFIYQFSGPESKVKYIGSSFILEFFYELRELFKGYKIDQTRINEKKLLEKINQFQTMINDECWDAHDIIYEEHLQFRDDTFKNPILVFVLSITRFFYYLSTFTVWVSLGYLYFAIWNRIVGIQSFPEWWTIIDGLYLLSSALIIYGVLLSVKSFAIKKNRRKNKTFKKLKGRTLKLFRG